MGKVLGLRWWTIALIMLGAILNFLTRSTLSVAAPTMMGELHISTQEYSYITGAFQVAIMFQPIVGYVLDTVGLKIGLAIFAAAWSVVCMAHGLAHSWQGFAGLRALLGFAEGSANPAGMKVISEWFPARERGLAGGIYNIGASVGSMLAPPLVAWAILAYDWQTAFVITGGLGLVWVVAWLLLYQSPTDSKALSDAERALVAAGQEKHLEPRDGRPPILQILKQRNFWGIALPR
ncbi:MAG TPA: MFS transporter, partial [Rhizomicrobium sp.]